MAYSLSSSTHHLADLANVKPLGQERGSTEYDYNKDITLGPVTLLSLFSSFGK